MKPPLAFLVVMLSGSLVSLDASEAVFDPCRFGAVPDGQTPSPQAIQDAIDACAEAGGGRVRLRGGRFRAGTLRLKSNVILHIEAGATLLGSPRVGDYPSTPSRFPSYTGEFVTGKMFLHAEGARNIGIEGRGTVDGSGDAWTGGPYGSPSFHSRPRLLHFVACENVAGYPGVGLFGVLPAHGFFVRHARGVVMENIRLSCAGDDQRPPIVCDDVEELVLSGLR